MQTDLIEILERFNRKERFFLVGEALGNCKFKMSDHFRRHLSNEIGVDIPDNALTAMDYHIDWIAAAVMQYASPDSGDVFENSGEVTGNQGDVDFLVAFKDAEGVYRLIFLEAKAYGSWNNKQMGSKAKRMKLIFGKDGDKYEGVKPYFCLISRRQPKMLNHAKWPKWWLKPDGSPYWLNLKLPDNRLRVTRWDAEVGGSSQGGKHFRIIKA